MPPNDTIALVKNEAVPAAGLDLNQLIKALIELNIARKNVLFYPGRHRQVKKSIDLAYGCFSLALEAVDEIALVVAKESISVGGCLLDPSNSVLQELRAVFKAKNIAALTFRQGLSREELAGFLLRITRSEETAGPQALAGEEPLAEAVTDNIRIQAVDYSKFSHTEEEVFRKKDAHGAKRPRDSVWNDFVHGLATGILIDPNEADPAEFVRRPTPSGIAGHLNRLEEIETELLKKYEDVIKDHLLNAAGPNDPQRDSGWVDLCRCFEELKPGLRDQFLAVTFDQCTLQANPEGLEPILGRLPLKLLIEMLKSATSGKKEMSPSLLNFVGKMLNARGARGQSPEHQAARRLANEIGALAAPEMAGTLFKKEDFGAYVTPDYETTLKQLVRPQTLQAPTEEGQVDIQRHLKTLGEDHLAAHIVEVGIALMAGPLDVEMYREVAEQMVKLANDLANKANTGLLSKLQLLLLAHSRVDPADGRCAAARASLDLLSGPRLIRTLRAALEVTGRWAEPEATAFLLALGPHAVPEALHLYLQHDEPQREQWLEVLIERYPQHLLKEVTKRLQLHAGAHTAELLQIFEKLGDPACSPSVRPFLQHPDEAVRLQALRALLRCNDEEGVNCLRKLFESRRHHDFLAALDLAERYSVASVATDMARRLKTRFLLYRSDMIRNEKILLALRNFGYRVADSDLERLSRIRFSFYPQQLARMKSVVSAMLSKRTPAPRPERAREAIARHDANAQ